MEDVPVHRDGPAPEVSRHLSDGVHRRPDLHRLRLRELAPETLEQVIGRGVRPHRKPVAPHLEVRHPVSASAICPHTRTGTVRQMRLVEAAGVKRRRAPFVVPCVAGSSSPSRSRAVVPPGLLLSPYPIGRPWCVADGPVHRSPSVAPRAVAPDASLATRAQLAGSHRPPPRYLVRPRVGSLQRDSHQDRSGPGHHRLSTSFAFAISRAR